MATSERVLSAWPAEGRSRCSAQSTTIVRSRACTPPCCRSPGEQLERALRQLEISSRSRCRRKSAHLCTGGSELDEIAAVDRVTNEVPPTLLEVFERADVIGVRVQ